MSTTNNTSFDSAIPVVVAPSTTISRYDATEAQLEVWLSSQQSSDANCAYNEISSLILHGNLDVEVLKAAVTEVVKRHPSLRSTFSADGQQVIVNSEPEFQFESWDFSAHESEKLERTSASVIHEQAKTPFDLVRGPLLRLVLQKLSDTKHKLTVTAHHLVMDGWSLALFCQDLGHFYDTISGVQREDLPAANHYPDYAREMANYMASEDGLADEAFWVDQYSDQIPVLELPIATPRPTLRTYNAERYDHQLNASLVESLRKVGAKSGCSLFNVMLAAFNAYVSRISGNDDFCVGIPTAGQAAMDQPELMGHCVNTMPLRTRVNSEASFADYMKSSRAELLDAFDHQRYSYGTLLRKLAPPRDPARSPMLSISFNLDPTIDTSELGFGDLDVEVVVEPRCFENFEWFINGVIREDKSIELQVQYNCDLFSAQSIEFYFEGFEAFLQEIASRPDASIAAYQTMSVPQRQQVVADWNETALEYPVNSTLDQEFSRQAKATPDKVAVQFENESLTYRDVENRSNQIARFLQQQGVSTGDLVGICVERSAEMLVTLFGIMKSGAGYVPLDPAYPDDRLAYMCEHSSLKIVVTESELMERVAKFEKPQIAIDAAAEQIANFDDHSVENNAKAADICYVIYTSGSTGKPKGVQVPHGCVVNFLYSMQQTPGFTANDSVLAVTTLSFDIAVLELYLPTISGGKVVILDSMKSADGKELANQLDQHNITLLQATPATWRLMIQAGWEGKSNLKALCGGEPMPQDLVKPLLSRCDELWNMYGPTETTVWSAVYQITDAEAPILIGKPIGNTQIYILDAKGNEVPVGCDGEVYIGGAGVTLGYRNRDDLTNERFVDSRYRNPFANFVSDKLYKTGDLAKHRFDGNIQFLRRNDKQVKIRGYRIELGEIEQNIKSHPAIEQNVVIVREDTPGDSRLVAYLIVKPDQNVTSVELRAHLRKTLPHYMVPQNFVELESMPQTNNGKIDYNALPKPQLEAPVDSATNDTAIPESAAEKYLADIWKDVLSTDDVGLDDTFFDIGGHSLLVMKVIATVHETTGIKLGPQDFLMSTLEQMADMLAESATFLNTNSIESTDDANPATATPAVMETGNKPDDAADELPTETVDESVDATADDERQKRPGIIRMLKGFWD